jgi:predicted Fe-Mo cluster-binding NifX family protein
MSIVDMSSPVPPHDPPTALPVGPVVRGCGQSMGTPRRETETGEPLKRRVALATASGSTVDQHFATAARFHIYDLVGNVWSLLEVRENESGQCGCGSTEGCGPRVFASVLALLADVDLVVVSRIGADAAAALLERGIRGHLASGPIEKILEELTVSAKLRFPLKRKGAGI